MNYESALGALPFNGVTKNNSQPPYIPYVSGSIAAPGNASGTQGRCSGMVPLLPYVEQNNVYPLYTFGVDWSDPANATALQIKFPLFRCPSSHAGDSVLIASTSWIGTGNNAFAPPSSPGATTNILGGALYPTGGTGPVTGWPGDYAPCTQIKTTKNALGAEIAFTNSVVAAGVPWAGGGSKGALRQNGPTRIGEITDGTSNTVIYSEAAARDKLCLGRTCTTLTGVSTAIWADSDNRITLTGTNADGSTNKNGTSFINVSNQSGDFYSFHTGGVNVSYVDGSVRFLRDNISITTMAGLITKGGGEITNVD